MCHRASTPRSIVITTFVLDTTPTYYTYFCHRRANLLNPKPASITSPPGAFVRGYKHALLEAGPPYLWGILTQRWRLGAYRFSYSMFCFLSLGRSVELALLVKVDRSNHILNNSATHCVPPQTLLLLQYSIQRWVFHSKSGSMVLGYNTVCESSVDKSTHSGQIS